MTNEKNDLLSKFIDSISLFQNTLLLRDRLCRQLFLSTAVSSSVTSIVQVELVTSKFEFSFNCRLFSHVDLQFVYLLAFEADVQVKAIRVITATGIGFLRFPLLPWIGLYTKLKCRLNVFCSTCCVKRRTEKISSLFTTPNDVLPDGNWLNSSSSESMSLCSSCRM